MIQENVFVDAWNMNGGYYPPDTGYSNGDQLLTVSYPYVEQGAVTVGVDKTGSGKGIVFKACLLYTSPSPRDS